MDIVIPNKVANVSNSASTFRVYDPNLYLGNTSPTHPPKPQNHHGCGIVGQIIETVVAVAVSYFFGSIAGDVARQLTAMALGDQKGFSFKQLGVDVATDLLTGGGGSTNPADMAVHAVEANVVRQGLSMAVGLQKKFDWAGVAVAGVVGGVTGWASQELSGTSFGISDPQLAGAARGFVSGMAGAIAGAASRSLITGSDFGDNLISELPDVVQTTGNSLLNYLNATYNAQHGDPGEAGGQSSDPLLAQIQAAGAQDAQAPLPVDGMYVDLSQLDTTLSTINFDGAPTPSTDLLAASSGGLLSNPLSADGLAQQMGLPNGQIGSTVDDVRLALSGEIEASPEGVPGFDKEAKDFGKDFIDVLGTLFGLKGPADVMGPMLANPMYKQTMIGNGMFRSTTIRLMTALKPKAGERPL
jgi:hypothetical protein